jgi:hypothetical protein
MNMNNSYQIEKMKKDIYLYNKFKSNDKHVASYIYNNIDKIKQDEFELTKMIMKIMSPIHSIKLLTEYELLNYKPEIKFDKIDDLIVFAITNIKKFQNVIGGYDIEDSEWLINESRFDCKTNQRVIYNTTEQKYNNDSNNNFISLYVDYLKRFVTENIKIKYKFIDDDDNEICWIVIIFEECDI